MLKALSTSPFSIELPYGPEPGVPNELVRPEKKEAGKLAKTNRRIVDQHLLPNR